MSERNIFKRNSRRNRRAAAGVKRMLPMTIADARVWLASIPAIQNLVFHNARGAGLIEYDKQSGLWAGITNNRQNGEQP